MRFASLVLTAVVVGGCSSSQKSADRCDGFTRLASREAVAMGLGDDGKAAPLAAKCADSTCLHVEDDEIAVTQPDGSRWQLRRGAAGPAVQPGTPRPSVLPAPPALSAEFRTCGTVEAGGGFGYNIIKNEGDVWNRIEWTQPPTAPDVVAGVAKNQYPLVGNDGSLCAFAEQTAPRQWTVHALRSGKTIDAVPNREKPPASCEGDGSVVVEKANGAVLIGVDGSESAVPVPARGTNTELSLTGRSAVANPRGAVKVGRAGGVSTSLTLPDDKDLGGAGLAPGTVREQVLAVGDGKSRLLIAERLRAPDCSVHESLALVDVDSKKAVALGSGDVVYTRLSWGLDRFTWVEAQPTLVDVSGN